MTISTRLIRAVVWVVLVSGPVLGGLALVSGTQPRAVVTPGASAPPLEPAQFAEAAVAAWLNADSQSDVDGLVAYFSTDIRVDDRVEAPKIVAVSAHQMEKVAPGYWSVTVAAQIGDEPSSEAAGDTEAVPAYGWRYFRTAVTVGASNSLVASLPAEVAGPETAQRPTLGYHATLDLGAAPARTVSMFLSSFLTGAGELDRYLTPGAQVLPLDGGVYQAVTLHQLRASTSLDTTQVVDGAAGDVLADVEATTVGGRRVALQYALRLTARAGRWEVSALHDVPRLAAANTQAPSPAVEPNESTS